MAPELVKKIRVYSCMLLLKTGFFRFLCDKIEKTGEDRVLRGKIAHVGLLISMYLHTNPNGIECE